MKRTILFITILALLPITADAQVKVESDGQTLVGSTAGMFSSGDGAKLRVLGAYDGSSLNPAKIDFGPFTGLVSIGEEATAGANLLLHGDGGIHFRVSAGKFLSYSASHLSDPLYVYANDFSFRYGTCISLYQSSDGRFKKEIEPLSSALSQLNKLRGVSYRQDLSEHSAYGKPKDVSGKDVAAIPLTADTSKHIGFIAQELQQVFPELVKTDKDGNLAINYTGIIPVIVEALKEQQSIITAQSGKINELQSEVETLRTGNTTPKKAKGTEAVNAFLYQNVPNPFNTTTTIRYFLSSEAIKASLYIFDMQGKLVESYPLDGAGEGSVEISAFGLQPGMYLYSLLVNNQEADTKRMVITD